MTKKCTMQMASGVLLFPLIVSLSRAFNIPPPQPYPFHQNPTSDFSVFPDREFQPNFDARHRDRRPCPPVSGVEVPFPIPEPESLVQGPRDLDPLQNKMTDNFPFVLYQKIRESKFGSGNIFFSPASIKLVLGMLHAGAAGATKTTIEKAMEWKSDADVASKIKAMVEVLSVPESNTDLNITSANRIYVEQTIPLDKSYQSTLVKGYDADAVNADFKGKTESERLAINDWIAEKTNNLIKDLFAEGSLTTDTTAVIVNALYFKALWQDPFKKEMMFEGDFTLDDGKQVKTTFMTREAKMFYTYSEKFNAHFVRLPYTANDTTFTIILPLEQAGMAELEKSLSSEALEEVSSQMKHPNKILLRLPKFKTTQKLEMKDIMEMLGMGVIFSNNADLTAMTADKVPVKVSTFVHKAFVSVDEEGTEAAAATGMGIQMMMLPPEVTCARPFLFAIHRGSTALFVGKLSDPREE